MIKIPVLPDTLRTEEEIIASWKRDVEKPLVSIRCATYNHEPYIESAIKGFLIQKTDFPIEIWIHDDASTDGTREIIESYQKKYPKIIKSILQDINQYSKGHKPGHILAMQCDGQYVAVCEGDDFWFHPKKLQKQFEALEGRPEINICFTAAYTLSPNETIQSTAPKRVQNSTIFHGKDVIVGGGGFMPTASIMYRNDKSVVDIIRALNAPVGDFFLQALFAFPHGALFLNIHTTVYRRGVPGSWTKRQDIESKFIHLHKVRDAQLKLSKIKPEMKESLYAANNRACYQYSRHFFLRFRFVKAWKALKLLTF